MTELKKIRTLTMKNPHNLSIYQIIEISLVIYSTHMIYKNQNEFIFYINNYIYWDQFNQLYDLYQVKQDI